MSIVGTSYHDPQEWKADKKEVSRCQESIQCQERTILRAETFVGVLRQSIDRLEERLETLNAQGKLLEAERLENFRQRTRKEPGTLGAAPFTD